ncbi:hypothetical protein BJ742DRAFT_787345 [Cladochytrium replicatum]|nr:hypothetical protein BJ742DRAFT_787345 [Cladochytrium replicatum]
MPDVVEQDIEQASHADQEIPSECMEQDPPESLFALDRRMEELLGDIRSLLDGRVKDMGSSAAGSREQLPFMPELMEFENYKELRQNRLENILSQTIPSRRQSCGVLIAEELRYHCDLGDPFKMENMFQMLLNFYMSRMHEILQQNYLLMSRWARFCKNSQKLLQFHPAFKTYQQKLSIEFKDSLERYERLKNIDGMLKRRSREIEVVNNSNRIEGEKRGDAEKIRTQLQLDQLRSQT